MDRRYKISVIDDESDILEHYVGLLENEFDVQAFQDPRKFLNSLDDPQKMPDLVITDFKMPQMDGIEMIKRCNKRNHFFPFIILSGHLDKETVMKAVDIGVFRLLEKPTDYDILRSCIDQLLVEHDIVSVRMEIRNLIAQLRELYTGIRLIMDQHIPPDIMKRMIVDAPRGKVKAKMGFDELLGSLESRLEQLLANEKVLEEIKSSKLRA